MYQYSIAFNLFLYYPLNALFLNKKKQNWGREARIFLDLFSCHRRDRAFPLARVYPRPTRWWVPMPKQIDDAT
jgi:hypothetical protein